MKYLIISIEINKPINCEIPYIIFFLQSKFGCELQYYFRRYCFHVANDHVLIIANLNERTVYKNKKSEDAT